MFKGGNMYLGIALASFFVGAVNAGTLYNGSSLAPVSTEQALSSVTPGQVVVVSENHGFAPHYDNQKKVLNQLALQLQHVSVGLEFFEKRFQADVDQFSSGKLSEEEFLKNLGWGSVPFDFYRDQALFPQSHGGTTLALNASRILTHKISQSGLASLSA